MMTDKAFKESTLTAEKLVSALKQVIRGRDDTLLLLVTALLADGHVLLEDYPGSGKTTLTKTLGQLIADDSNTSKDYILPFRRIQFTPDMLPGDVLGVNVFEPEAARFKFIHGPIFAHVVLADEINRTGPKVQAAFLECMAEKQVTVDNATHPLDDLFFVVGTQNPLDIAGTYALPIVQLDRFIFKLPMRYVDAVTEIEILAQHQQIQESARASASVVTRSEVLTARKEATQIFLSDQMRSTIVSLVQATRNNPAFQFGASTRAALMLQQALRAWALVNGRQFVTEDDFKFIAPYVLGHRLYSAGGRAGDGAELKELIATEVERLVRDS